MKTAIIVLSFALIFALGIGFLFGVSHGKSFDYRRGINDADTHFRHREEALWEKIIELEQSPDVCLRCGKDMEAEAVEQDTKRIREMNPELFTK